MNLFANKSKILMFVLLITVFCFLACQDKEKASANPTKLNPETNIDNQLKPNTFYKYAYAMRGCAPWDGAAVQIYLSDEPLTEKGQIQKPLLSIFIYKDISEISEKIFKLGQDFNIGTASLCPKEGKCQLIKSGTVIIKSVSPDKNIQGEYEIEFEGNIKKIGKFQTSWMKEMIPCG